MKHVPVLAVLAALAFPTAAAADGDPIMPLSQVQRGMHCTAYSVLHGTEISSFDVEILDIVTGDAISDTRILFRASGPAIDETGIGPGFSGSPIYCPDDQGTMRNAGAISQGIGEYGNKVALATPIEQMLAEPVTPPSSARHDPRMLRRARPFSLPLTLSGVSPWLAPVIQRAAAHAGKTVLAGPAAPRADFPVQQLRPGAAFSASLSSGALAASAIGTITYVDGDQIWGFGHPLDSVGRRDLFLQDAYVYDIVNNPLGVGDASTYKLAAPGHDVGTLLGDGINAVTGKLGALPDRFPLKVSAKDSDTGKTAFLVSDIADETAIGQPSGVSGLASVGPISVGQAAYLVMRGSPARQSAALCMRISLRERPKPMRFCNTYVGGSPGQAGIVGSPMVADVSQAISLLDSYNFGTLHLTSVDVDMRLSRGLAQAFMLNITGPRVLHRGHTYSFDVAVQRVRGAKSTKTIKVRVPMATPVGDQELVLTGSSADSSGDPSEGDLSILLGFGDDSSDEAGPKSIKSLAHQIARIHRYDGVHAAFRDPDAGAEDNPPVGKRVFLDPSLRLSGTAHRHVVIAR